MKFQFLRMYARGYTVSNKYALLALQSHVAFVAQWQSTGLVNQGSGVRSSSEAFFSISDFF